MATRNDKSNGAHGASGKELSPEQRRAAWRALDNWRRKALSDPKVTPAAFRVGYALTLRVDWGTLEGACPAQAEIARVTCLNKRTVLESLKLLQQRGYISSVPRWNSSKKYTLVVQDARENSLLADGEVQDFSLPDDVQEFSLQESGQRSDKCRNSHFGCAENLTSKVKNPATYISSTSVTVSPAVPSEARLSAPSSVTAEGAAVVDRLGVAIEAQESPPRTDSLPSPAGSLSRLPARSPAEEGPANGSEAARYESLDPWPAYEGDVPEIGEPETAKVDPNELLRQWEEEQKRRDADPDFIHPF